MDNIIIRKTLSIIWKLLVVYSLYILLRGHNEPGGGFIGGLLLALGLILRGYTTSIDVLGEFLEFNYLKFLGLSLVVFLFTIFLPTLSGADVFTGLWTTIWIPIAGKLSTVLVFDIGVYLVVSSSAVYAHWVLCLQADEGAR